jgi:hypothetical protein
MNWRHFWYVFAVLFVALLGLGVTLILRNRLEPLAIISLGIFFVALALLLSFAVTGGHAVIARWRKGDLRAGDFALPLLVLGCWVAWLVSSMAGLGTLALVFGLVSWSLAVVFLLVASVGY